MSSMLSNSNEDFLRTDDELLEHDQDDAFADEVGESSDDNAYASKDVVSRKAKVDRRSMVKALKKHAAYILQALRRDACEKGHGIFFWLGWRHAVGPIAYVEYSWTQQEKETYRKHDTLPVQMFELTPSTSLLIITFALWRPDRYPQSSVGRIYTRGSKFVWRQQNTIYLVFPAESLVELLPAPLMVIPSEGLNPKGIQTTEWFTDEYRNAERVLRFPVNDLYDVIQKFMSPNEIEELGIADLKFHPSRYRHGLRDILQVSTGQRLKSSSSVAGLPENQGSPRRSMDKGKGKAVEQSEDVRSLREGQNNDDGSSEQSTESEQNEDSVEECSEDDDGYAMTDTEDEE